MAPSSLADVAVGDVAPVVHHRLTRTDLVRYAGASGDFNPMHHDELLATAAMQPSVFGHGMFSMGLVGTALTNYLGIGVLRSFSVRFVRQTWPGEELSTSIVVTAITGAGAERLVQLEVGLHSAEGEVKVAGQATAALPAPAG